MSFSILIFSILFNVPVSEVKVQESSSLSHNFSLGSHFQVSELCVYVDEVNSESAAVHVDKSQCLTYCPSLMHHNCFWFVCPVKSIFQSLCGVLRTRENLFGKNWGQSICVIYLGHDILASPRSLSLSLSLSSASLFVTRATMHSRSAMPSRTARSTPAAAAARTHAFAILSSNPADCS